MRNKKIYLLLVNSETIFTKFLRIFTGNQYNHVVFAMDKQCKDLYTYARWIVWFPIFAGFEIENTNKGILKKKPETICRIYEINVSDDEYGLIENKLERFINGPRKHFWYNFLALPCIQFNIPYKNENNFVCSTFVAYMLGSLLKINKKYSHTTPNDFLALDLPLVYEGKLTDYNPNKLLAI